MSKTPRVILMTIPASGYDRGLLEGITSYAQIHGPWVFFLSGDHPDVPIPSSDSLSGDYSRWEHPTSGKASVLIPNFERLNATGVIAKIHSSETAKQLLSAGLPIVGTISVSEAKLADIDLRSKVSEIVADADKIGQLVAEHFLARGFWSYAFCGYEGRVWSERRLDGFAKRLQEAAFSAQVYRPSGTRRRLSWKQEMPLVMSWLKSLPRPVAVMACNDRARASDSRSLLALRIEGARGRGRCRRRQRSLIRQSVEPAAVERRAQSEEGGLSGGTTSRPACSPSGPKESTDPDRGPLGRRAPFFGCHCDQRSARGCRTAIHPRTRKGANRSQRCG